MKDYVYLIKIDSEKNNNRYYKMTRKNDFFKIEYGRVGARPVEMVRPMTLWDVTVQKKIKEGYVDRTDYLNIHTNSNYAPIPDKEVQSLISDLMHYAKKKIDDSYTVTIQETSEQMVNTAKQKLSNLSRIYSVSEFNQELCILFQIIPRKMKNVKEMLASSPEDFQKIISREQDILDVMSSGVNRECKLGKVTDKDTILDILGLDIRVCTDKENETIISHLSKESAQFFKKAYRVHHLESERAYYKWCEQNHAETHYYYHGSKNGNYMGIMSEGLKLYPDAPITGKMFGYGLYFAPRAKKSMGYTSLKGSHWARGNSNQAFLAVFKVAYKNAKHVSKHERYMCELSNKSIKPYDALFAHGGIDLINDEIIVYDERQVTIQYLIELQV